MSEEIAKSATRDTLIEELKGIITEGVFNSRWTLIETYWRVGQVLLENDLPVKEIAIELKQKERLLYQCKQFYKTYPILEKLPMGKNVSWHKIANELLPEHKKEKPNLKALIKEFIKDMFPADRRKEFIKEIVSEWELWRK